MPAPFTAVGKNVDRLVSTINTVFNQQLAKESTVFEKISWVDRTTGGIEALYPMQVSAYSEIARGPTEPRQFSDAEVVSIMVKAERIEIEKGLVVPIGPEYDPYNIIKMNAPGLMRSASRMWDRSLANLIRSNPLAYDNTPFFGTHSTNPAKVGAGTFTNDITAGVDKAGVIKALDTLTNFAGYDGKLFNTDLGMPIFLVPTIEIEVALKELFNGGIIAQPVNASAASVTTHLVNYGQIIRLPELVNDADPLSRKRYYVLNMNYGNRAPLITRILQEPTLVVTSGGSDDYMYVSRNGRAMFYIAHGGVGLGLPQLALRCTIGP